jgi:carboxymethylenebutenolidase
MQTKWLTIATADGPMHAYLAMPDGAGPYRAIVVLQEAFGVNHYLRSVTERLADAGYVALAPELLHRSGTHVEVPYDDTGQAAPIFEKIDNATIEEDVGAAIAALRARPEVDPKRIGAVGFCIGGFAAILAGLTTAVAAIVAFYPGTLVRAHPRLRLEPLVERMPRLHAATLCIFGERDHAISADDVGVVRAALAKSPSRHEVVVYPNAAHGFHTEDRTGAYEPVTAEQAWHKTLAWLEDMLR